MTTWTLPDMNIDGVFFVDESRINLRDFVNAKPGAIVRCSGLPAVQYVPNPLDDYSRLAGLISDAA